MRVKPSEQYADEREQICKKLIEILQLDSDNGFLLSDLDADLEKQASIMSLKNEIQRCFAVSKISSFKPNFECKRPYLNIIRSILRKQGYSFFSADCNIKVNDVFKRTQKYIIFRK